MFFLGIVTSIFGALVLAVILWVLCAFSGRLVNLNFRMTVLHHCVMCITIAIPTVVLLTVFFLFGKAGQMVTQAETGIAKVMLADEQFTNQMRGKIDQTSSTTDAEVLTDYLAQKFIGSVSSEYPMLVKYVNMADLLEKSDIKRQMSGILQGVNLADIEKTQQVVQTAVGSFTKGIRSRINSVRRVTLIAVILLQIIAFGAVFYRAGKYRHSARLTNYEDV